MISKRPTGVGYCDWPDGDAERPQPLPLLRVERDVVQRAVDDERRRQQALAVTAGLTTFVGSATGPRSGCRSAAAIAAVACGDVEPAAPLVGHDDRARS